MADEQDREALQQGWWGEGEEEEVDPELVALGQGRDSVLRPVLMLLVLVMAGFILSDWREELAYFLSPEEPLELGSVTEFPTKRAEDPSWSPSLPHNRYVSLEGVAEAPSISRRYKYFKLIGGEVYVETSREDADDSDMERLQKDRFERGAEESEYFRFSGSGRALSFSAMPKRYETLKQYYGRAYNTTFCVDLDAKTRAQLERDQRETIAEVWKERYEAASPEERARRELGKWPSPAQERQLMDARPVCVDAWLIQAGKAPKDHWWYVVLAGVFALFMLVDLVFLVRWVARFLKPQDDI